MDDEQGYPYFRQPPNITINRPLTLMILPLTSAISKKWQFSTAQSQSIQTRSGKNHGWVLLGKTQSENMIFTARFFRVFCNICQVCFQSRGNSGKWGYQLRIGDYSAFNSRKCSSRGLQTSVSKNYQKHPETTNQIGSRMGTKSVSFGMFWTQLSTKLATSMEIYGLWCFGWKKSCTSW